MVNELPLDHLVYLSTPLSASPERSSIDRVLPLKAAVFEFKMGANPRIGLWNKVKQRTV